MKKPSISGIIAQSKITWDPEKQGAAYFTEQGDIFANYKGSKKLTLNIDGLDFSILVRVSDPAYADFNIIMYKGMGKTLKLKGLVPGSKVSFSSNNKKKVIDYIQRQNESEEDRSYKYYSKGGWTHV